MEKRDITRPSSIFSKTLRACKKWAQQNIYLHTKAHTHTHTHNLDMLPLTQMCCKTNAVCEIKITAAHGDVYYAEISR